MGLPYSGWRLGPEGQKAYRKQRDRELLYMVPLVFLVLPALIVFFLFHDILGVR